MLLNSVMFFSACEGSPRAEQRMTDPNGVWVCQYILYSKTECALGNLREEYKREHGYPEYIFLPSYIGDVKVVQLGFTSGMWVNKCGGIKKTFVPHTVQKIEAWGGKIMVSTKAIYISNTIGGVYVPEEYLQDYLDLNGSDTHKANVEYLVNYENAEHKYHCVDNYEYSTETTPSYITIVPPDPEREGYIFDGWYKEAECINEWDFKEDALPLMKIEQVQVFQKTSLYAKWNKESIE